MKCSFKTSDSVVQKQRVLRHRYLLNMNQHPKETSVGWRRMSNGATWKTAGLMGPYARRIACAKNSETDCTVITTGANKGPHSARNTWLGRH